MSQIDFTNEDISMTIFSYLEWGDKQRAANNLKKALEHYDRAKEIMNYLPDVSDEILHKLEMKRAMTLLTMGHWHEGFTLFENRNKLASFIEACRDYPQEKQWNGQPVEGKNLLIIGEQGFGDIIQFARFIPLVKEKGCTITLLVRQALIPLFKNLPYIDEILPLMPYDRMKRLEFDYWIKILSLPLKVEGIPTNTPYLWADSEKVKEWSKYINKNTYNIGLVWGAYTKHPAGKERSIPLKALKPLAVSDKMTFYSLQKGQQTKEKPPKGMQFIDLSDQINDFSDTAALMENMDLIITVDTSTAHLAGALNRPVWTFVHYSNDWRWLENDNGITIWYPSMEIYRQTSLNDWIRIIKKMATDLECLAELYL